MADSKEKQANRNYLLGRINEAARYINPSKTKDTPEVTAARKVINDFEEKDTAARAVLKRKLVKMKEEAREAVYFGEPEDALVKVKAFEEEYAKAVKVEEE